VLDCKKAGLQFVRDDGWMRVLARTAVSTAKVAVVVSGEVGRSEV
jgi:hypothetical protein